MLSHPLLRRLLPKDSPGQTPAGQPFTFTPIFIRKADTVVSWSPKAGCSHVVLWAFIHEGCFRQATVDSPLPHKFRIHVYQKQPAYRRMLRQLKREGGAGRTLLKVTRDPKSRLISIFRHACRYPFLHKDVRAILGFDPAVEGFSLVDLDALLGHLRLTPPTTADPHVRGQYSPLWDMGFARVITLNLDEVPLNASLNAVERSLGLPVTGFDRLPEFQRLRETHYAKREAAWDDARSLESYRFKPQETRAFPKQRIMVSPLFERMARRHYRADYGRTGSSDTSGALFSPEPRLTAR